MKKVFISVPMQGRSFEEIERDQKEIFAECGFDETEWEILDNVLETWVAPRGNDTWYLGKSVQVLGEADCAVFSWDWHAARGCCVEHYICRLYHIPMLYSSPSKKGL